MFEPKIILEDKVILDKYSLLADWDDVRTFIKAELLVEKGQ